MTLKSKSLKTRARASIRATAPSAILVTLVYLLCTDVLDSLIYLFTPDFTINDLIYRNGAGAWMTLFLTILMALFVVVLRFGYWCWALGVSRDRSPGYGTLMDGFGMIGHVLLMELLIFLRIFGWTMFLSISYMMLAMAFYSMTSLVVLLSILLYLSILAVSLRYELAPLLLCDYPEAGSAAAVRRSAGMMRGNIWSYVKLHLSFWPWYLLMLAISVAGSVALLAPSLDSIAQAYAAGGFEQIFILVNTALNTASSSLMAVLIAVPVKLFFLPRRHVAVANFYRALSSEPVEPAF